MNTNNKEVSRNEFFKNEFRKIIGDSEILKNPRVVGNVCFGFLNRNLRARIEFGNPVSRENYTSLNMTILCPSSGIIDRLELNLKDIFPLHSTSPRIQVSGDDIKWTPFEPSAGYYNKFRECIEDYLDVFRYIDEQKTYSLGQDTTPGETWITVYKDTLGFPNDKDNLTEVLVPTNWLVNQIEAEGVSLEAWLDTYTADNTDVFLPKAIEEGAILDCVDPYIAKTLFSRQAGSLDAMIHNAEKRSAGQTPSKTSGFEHSF